jgi:hypothetical protein
MVVLRRLCSRHSVVARLLCSSLGHLKSYCGNPVKSKYKTTMSALRLHLPLPKHHFTQTQPELKKRLGVLCAIELFVHWCKCRDSLCRPHQGHHWQRLPLYCLVALLSWLRLSPTILVSFTWNFGVIRSFVFYDMIDRKKLYQRSLFIIIYRTSLVVRFDRECLYDGV